MLTQIPLKNLVPSHVQPREVFDEESLQSLSDSIKQYGLLQPLIVRKKGDKFYEIIAGERRYKASLLADIDKVPCLVMDLSDDSSLAIALVENLQREDLNPIEEAKAYQRLMQCLNLSQENVALRVGKDRSSVANSLRLLHLPQKIQSLVAANELSMGHAKAVLGLSSIDLMLYAAEKIIHEGLSVRKAESLIKAMNKGAALKRKHNENNNDNWEIESRQVELKIAEKLGTKVRLQKDGAGFVLWARYAGLDELNGLLERLEIIF